MGTGMNAIYVIWLREMKKYVRNKSRLVGNLMMPFLFLAFMGTGFNSIISTGPVSYTHLTLPTN